MLQSKHLRHVYRMLNPVRILVTKPNHPQGRVGISESDGYGLWYLASTSFRLNHMKTYIIQFQWKILAQSKALPIAMHHLIWHKP